MSTKNGTEIDIQQLVNSSAYFFFFDFFSLVCWLLFSESNFLVSIFLGFCQLRGFFLYIGQGGNVSWKKTKTNKHMIRKMENSHKKV